MKNGEVLWAQTASQLFCCEPQSLERRDLVFNSGVTGRFPGLGGVAVRGSAHRELLAELESWFLKVSSDTADIKATRWCI